MDPPFDKARHLRYWQRCLRSLLPQPYTANDSTRMTLGCFAVAAVDLLEAGAAPPVLSPADRARLRAWVLACQHPAGGFAGGPTHVLPRAAYDGFAFAPAPPPAPGHHPAGRPAVGARGEANLAATLFALQLLALLGSDGDSGAADASFAGVDRAATLRWLRQLQRADGSFGEYVDAVVDRRGGGGRRRLVGGGADMRYCYMAAMVRWMLRGGGGGDPGEPPVGPGSPLWVEDIDVDGLVAYIRQGQTYDGGFAESATHESHAGYAFCAVAALSLLQRSAPASADSVLARGIADLPALLRWLSARCFLYRPAAAGSDDADDDSGSDDDAAWHESVTTDVTPADRLRPDAHPLLAFNGRANKHADTCYTWWTLGTMAILARAGAVPAAPASSDGDSNPWPASRRFLLEQTQHRIGGFAKTPGGPPDLYHAYLGLAVLAVQGEPALPPFDAAVCVSAAAVAKIEAARGGLLRAGGAAAVARRAALLRMGRRQAVPAEG